MSCLNCFRRKKKEKEIDITDQRKVKPVPTSADNKRFQNIIKDKDGAPSLTDQRPQDQKKAKDVSKITAAQSLRENGFRIIIVGDVGSGKSSLANSLIGPKRFKTAISGSGETKECKKETSFVHRETLTVVDTVGFTSECFKKSELLNGFIDLSPGPHAVLMTICPSQRFTNRFMTPIKRFFKVFGKGVYDYLIFVVTHEDQLEKEKCTIEDFLETTPEEFKAMYKDCGKRLITINNRGLDKEKDDKIEILIDMIKKIKESSEYFNFEKF